MTNTLPGHIGDVQQAVNATEVDERAVVGQILNDTLNVLAFLHGSQQLFTLVAVFFFQHCTARYHNVVAFLVELDDLKF